MRIGYGPSMPLVAHHNPGAPIDLVLGGLALTAFSISGLATYVMVPAMEACFDLGHCPVEASKLRDVFLTHVHQDHAGGAHRHLALRRMLGMSPPRLHCPEEGAEGLRGLLRCWDALEEKSDADPGSSVYGLRAGDHVDLGRRYTVHAFDVVHRIASRGYTVVEHRRSLLPAFVGRPGEEIRAARERGDEVYRFNDHSALTYIGDSTLETLRRHPEVGQSEVLFLEATHLGETSPARSAQWGHTHLDELVDLWRESPGTLASKYIVLKHFSMRYHPEAIRAAVGRIPEELRRRVTVLL